MKLEKPHYISKFLEVLGPTLWQGLVTCSFITTAKQHWLLSKPLTALNFKSLRNIYRSKGYRHTFIVIGMIKLSQEVLDSSVRQVATYNNKPRTNHFLHSKISSIWPTIVTHLSIKITCHVITCTKKEMQKISKKPQTCATQAGGSHWSGEVR